MYPRATHLKSRGDALGIDPGIPGVEHPFPQIHRVRRHGTSRRRRTTEGVLRTRGKRSSVSKYMARGRKPSSQTWRAFLENHVNDLVSVDFFTVPTVRFQVLYVFLVLAHDRRRIVHVNVTAHPTAEWAG